MRIRARASGTVAVAIAVLALLGCTSPLSDSGRPERTSQMSEDIRHDTEPLTQYFPLIGRPVAVSWLGWSNSSSRAPGPSMYWVDAVVELEPGTADALRERYAPTEQAAAPTLSGELRSMVPAGTYLTGHDLDIALGGSQEWGGNALGYLHRDRPLLVFQATSGG